MSCGCPSKSNSNNNMTGTLVGGALMGAAIYLLDILLRPQFANGGMELILFLIEGVACDLVYGLIEDSYTAGSGFGTNVSVKKSVVAALTIWLTDIFLRTSNFTGAGTEMIKFFIQGFIVMFALGYKM